MTDELDMRVPIDPSRVNVKDQWEIEYWCAEWGCTEDELVAFVRKFGDNAEALGAHLKALGALRKSQRDPL